MKWGLCVGADVVLWLLRNGIVTTKEDGMMKLFSFSLGTFL